MSNFNVLAGNGISGVGALFALKCLYDSTTFLIKPNFDGMNREQRVRLIVSQSFHWLSLCLVAYGCLQIGAFACQLSASAPLIPAIVDFLVAMDELGNFFALYFIAAIVAEHASLERFI